MNDMQRFIETAKPILDYIREHIDKLEDVFVNETNELFADDELKNLSDNFDEFASNNKDYIIDFGINIDDLCTSSYDYGFKRGFLTATLLLGMSMQEVEKNATEPMEQLYN